MAVIKIAFENDGEAVWFWELCKKLGYGQLEVVFGNDITDTNCELDVLHKSSAKCENRREENYACETEAEGVGEIRKVGKPKNRKLARFIAKNSR